MSEKGLTSVTLSCVIVQIWPDREFPVAAGNVALKRLHTFVESQVLPQMRGLGVGLAAHIAQILTEFAIQSR
jgi:hypothetical protein